MNEERDLREAEQQLLQASLLGDIREDVHFAGLSLQDFLWIVVVTMCIGGVAFVMPIAPLVKIVWFFFVFVVYTYARYLKIPFRLRRWMRYLRLPGTRKGEQLGDVLGAESDAWLYRSGKVWQMVIRIEALPWLTAVYAEKRSRLIGFEQFLRACVRERMEASISAEQMPDFQWELWRLKREKPKATQGIAKLTHRRIDQWERQAKSGVARRSEYILRLSVYEHTLSLQQRDDEPEGLSKADARRYRLLAELRAKKDAVLAPLENAGHTCSLLSGYAIAELLGRQWAPLAWTAWKAGKGTWEDKEEEPDIHAIPIDAVPLDTDTMAEGMTETASPVATTLDTVDKQAGKATSAHRWREKLIVVIHRIGVQLARLRRWFVAMLAFIKRARFMRKHVSGEEMATTMATVPEAVATLETVPVTTPVVEDPSAAVRVVLLTAPASTGKTFVAANLAVASATSEHPIALLDLSPDQGTLTFINPIAAEEFEGWRTYTVRSVPGLTIWVPETVEAWYVKSVSDRVQELAATHRVVVDLSWRYPHRDQLLALGLAVAVIDSDYHHWTCWERVTAHWNGLVWQTQGEIDLSMLVQEHFQLPIARTWRTYPEARERLFQGRALALDGGIRSDFYWPQGGNP